MPPGQRLVQKLVRRTCLCLNLLVTAWLGAEEELIAVDVAFVDLQRAWRYTHLGQAGLSCVICRNLSAATRYVTRLYKAQNAAMEGHGRSQRRRGGSTDQWSQICIILMGSRVRIRAPVKRGIWIRIKVIRIRNPVMLDVPVRAQLRNVKPNLNTCYILPSRSREHFDFARDDFM